MQGRVSVVGQQRDQRVRLARLQPLGRRLERRRAGHAEHRPHTHHGA